MIRTVRQKSRVGIGSSALVQEDNKGYLCLMEGIGKVAGEVIDRRSGIDEKDRPVHTGCQDLPGELKPLLPGRAIDMDVTPVVAAIRPKSSAIVVVPPAQSASTCFDSGSSVVIRVVFPAPYEPKTTIFSFFHLPL